MPLPFLLGACHRKDCSGPTLGLTMPPVWPDDMLLLLQVSSLCRQARPSKRPGSQLATPHILLFLWVLR